MSQIEGRRPVLEALRSGRAVQKVLVSADAKPAPIVDEILKAAGRRGVPVERVPRARIDEAARSHNPQGVLAVVPGFRYASLDDVLTMAAGRGEAPLLVALDGVTDPHNVGAVARTAEAAGAHGLLLPSRRSAQVGPAVEKAAAGALAWLPVVQVIGLPATLTDLRKRGIWCVALEAGAGVHVWDLQVATEGICLVLGSEGRGLGRLVRERCDLAAGIPLPGHVASLNVSVAAGIALVAVARLRAQGGHGGDPI